MCVCVGVCVRVGVWVSVGVCVRVGVWVSVCVCVRAYALWHVERKPGDQSAD